METITLIALLLFIVTYILIISLSNHRPLIALSSALIFIIFQIIPLQNVISAIDFNVLLMIGGTMGLVYLFIESKMPDLMAEIIIDHMPDIKWMTISLAIFAGIISAFIDNVATVLMIAPVAITLCRKLDISPVKPIIAISISSNLEGAATLVGDTTSILLGAYNHMTFLDFFFYEGRIGIFWIVQIALIASTAVLYLFFRNNNQKIEYQGNTKVTDYFPSILLITMVILLISASFLPSNALPEIIKNNINGLICFTLLIIGCIKHYIDTKDSVFTIKVIKEIDFQTLGLLVGLFIIIAGIKEAKVIDLLANAIVSIGKDNVFLLYTVIVWGSVLLSAFIDNIPYVLTMLPVISGIAHSLGIDQTLLMLALLSGATLGGNLTPVGASANITSIGLLKKNGYDVSNKEFMKLSIPYTLTAVAVGYILIWIIYA